MKTQRMIQDHNDEKQRKAAMEENQDAIVRMLEEQGQSATMGKWEHEVGRIKGLQRLQMTGMVTTIWTPE